MIDKVVIFGDSFNYGHGCKDRVFYFDDNTKSFVGSKENIPDNSPSEYCWGSLLQKAYPNLKVHNLSNPGRSNAHIFRDFLTYSENDHENKENTVVFFQLTNPDRIEIASHDHRNTASYVLSMAGNHTDHDMGEAVRRFIKYMYHPSMGENTGFMTMLSAYALAKIQNYKFYWTCSRIAYPWDTYDFIANTAYMKRTNVEDIRNYDFSRTFDNNINQIYRSPDNHINDMGHELYFNKIIQPLLAPYLV